MSNNKQRVLLSWSSGKDSAWCLHVLRQRDDVEVVALMTTFNKDVDRVALHAVRRQLVMLQAEATGLPLIPVHLPRLCPNDIYENAMQDALRKAVKQFDIHAIAFGDLFLADIRVYREKLISTCDIEALFPLWNLPTDVLAREMISSGLQAILTCVDPNQCPAKFIGRRFDRLLLDQFPDAVDPCGENGEFHSYAFAGPMFDAAIDVTVGETVERHGFVFADLLPAQLYEVVKQIN